jgi:hypothetical protein
MNLSSPPRTETPIVSMRMQRASPAKSPLSFSRRTFNEFPKATENQYPSQDQSTSTENNMLTLIEKLIDTQQATEQVLKNMATLRTQC